MINQVRDRVTYIHIGNPGINTGVDILLKASGKSKSELSVKEFQAYQEY